MQLPEEFVLPAYDGRSLANVPAAIAEMLQVPFAGLPPLPEALWQPLAAGTKRVVVLLLDAFGWNLLQAEQQSLSPLLKKADCLEKLTSVFPSTTVAALSSLWTGAAPAQHGLLGLTLFFPEYGTAGQMLAFTPAFGNYPDSLIEAGLKPESFLQWPGFAEQLGRQGIPTYTLKGRHIVDSALTKMHGRGVTAVQGVITFTDMLAQIRTLLDENAGQPMYVWAYWPTIDSLSHYRLWDSEATRAEIRTLFYQIETEFLNRLPAKARQDTLFFILADHGQVAFPQHIYIEDHPALRQMLFMNPTGEPRVSYLYAKHGRRQDILNYISTHLNEAMVAVSAEKALLSGLFGPEPHTAVARERIGDVVAIMRGGYVLLTRSQKKLARVMIGGHGSLTPGEMELPWIGFRLDGW